MLLERLLPLFTVILLAQAYTLPDNASDGVYSAKMQNGVEVHERISDFPSSTELKTKRDSVSATSPIPRLFARQAQTMSFCGCGFNMNPGNCDEAVAVLKDHLDVNHNTGFWGEFSFYITRGSVVASIA